MMNKLKKISRRLIVISALVIFATLAALLAQCGEQYREQATGAVRSVSGLPDFKTEDVRAIELRFGAAPPVRLVLRNNVWKVQTDKKPEMFANARKIAELLNELNRTRLLRELYLTDEAAAEQLALADYQKGKTVRNARTGKNMTYYGCELLIYGADEKRPLLNMMCGNAHYKPAEMISGNYSMQTPDGRYIRLTGADGRKSYFLISRIFEECFPMSGLWIEQLRCNSFDAPRSIRYSKKDKTVWQVKGLSGRNFYLAEPAGKKLAHQNIDSKLKLMFSPFTRDIAPEGTVFTPDSTLEIDLENGMNYVIRMQDDPVNEYKRLCSMTVTFDAAKLVRKSGETDEQFEKRKRILTHDAAVEKEWFEGKIFILQPNVIRILEEIPEAE